MAAEYYNFKDEINDRKKKLLRNAEYRDKLEVDKIMVKYTCIDKEPTEEYQRQKYRFVIPDVNDKLYRLLEWQEGLLTTLD